MKQRKQLVMTKSEWKKLVKAKIEEKANEIYENE